MALGTNDFILLRMIFNDNLYRAVLDKDEQGIMTILQLNYAGELEDPAFVRPEPINVEFLYDEFQRQDKEERDTGSNYQWAL